MITRRDFLKSMTTAVFSVLFSPLVPKKSVAMPKTEGARGFISVANGTDKAALVDAVLDQLGGIQRYVNKGDSVAIKPNAAWSRTPEEAANVHPDILTRMIDLCYAAGAKEVKVVEHTCDNSKSAFKISGIQKAVKCTRASLRSLEKPSDFIKVDVPQGIKVKTAHISKVIHSADVFINMPIAKSHGAATLTLGMKNHMGAVEDRWFFHRNDLHQCIADVSTVLQPDLTLIDATRIMTTNGPKGPGNVRVVNKIIAGTDQVALDSYAATLFDMAGEDIGHIQAAYEHGLGEIDLAKIEIKEVNI